ncbi:MAG TPA: helix-turn-helix transcriptional regulator [Myxococcaceae bacterium]|nr:helix-turn-helix transcriptional regulator [Myxococcaceae bacterium]
MTATEEPTLYDVLEVDPASSLDELRAAVERARETYGQESLAVYALVDEDQLEELRARLDEAATVLLDPARRASYDRSIGRIGPATLWAEDDEEDETPLPPVEPGPHARAADLDMDEEPGGEEEPPPRQQALALDVSEGPGPFGRTAELPSPEAPPEAAPEPEKPAPLLSGDWAAAVPAPQQTADTSGREVAPESGGEGMSTDGGAPPERTTLPPALGLRLKPAPRAASPPPVAVAPEEPPPAPASPPPAAAPELPTRAGESRRKLDIASDAEFNGELLRRVRESHGLSLQQVAERTRITRIHLENVEADRYDRLPATVYLRGILVNLARELRLDPARVSKTYLLAAQRSPARGAVGPGRD